MASSVHPKINGERIGIPENYQQTNDDNEKDISIEFESECNRSPLQSAPMMDHSLAQLHNLIRHPVPVESLNLLIKNRAPVQLAKFLPI